MENNNRTILAIALIVLVWSGYSMFFAPQPAPVTPAPQSAAEEKQVSDTPDLAAKNVAPVEIAPSYKVNNDYQEKVISVTEGMIVSLFKETLNLDLAPPFKRLTFDESMDRFGTDRPDMRFGMELVDLTQIASSCSSLFSLGC